MVRVPHELAVGLGEYPVTVSVQCRTSLSPDLPEADACLVIDLFRATTTLVSFFTHGGLRCLPVETVDEARALRASLGPLWILAGERDALPPEGFDLGNSPRAFAGMKPARWEGMVMTTTNGTRGLLKAAKCGGTVLVACGLNAGAAASRALQFGDRITILCCGQEGKPALEDSICAGLLVERLLLLRPGLSLERGARTVLEAWCRAGRKLEAAKRSLHARRLREIGFSEDLDFCCRLDATGIVQRYDLSTGLVLAC